MAGDDTTGVCVIEIAEELDAGPIHGIAPIAVGPQDDAGTIRRRALELAVPLLAAALRGETTATPQEGVGVTYASKITAADRRLDWTRPSVEIDRTVRALAPDIGARTELDGRPVLIWSGRPMPARGDVPAGLTHHCAWPAAPVSTRSSSYSRRASAGWRLPTISAASRLPRCRPSKDTGYAARSSRERDHSASTSSGETGCESR